MAALAAPGVVAVDITAVVAAVAIVALLTWLLVLGVKESARINTAMVVLKVAILLFFIIAGAIYVRPENWQPFAPNGWTGIGAGAAIIFFAYIGFDAVSTAAEECRNPQRDMPIGMIGSLLLSIRTPTTRLPGRCAPTCPVRTTCTATS